MNRETIPSRNRIVEWIVHPIDVCCWKHHRHLLVKHKVPEYTACANSKHIYHHWHMWELHPPAGKLRSLFFSFPENTGFFTRAYFRMSYSCWWSTWAKGHKRQNAGNLFASNVHFFSFPGRPTVILAHENTIHLSVYVLSLSALHNLSRPDSTASVVDSTSWRRRT